MSRAPAVTSAASASEHNEGLLQRSCILCTAATAALTVLECQMCCAADRCREVLPHIVVSVVCLLSVADVRTVALSAASSSRDLLHLLPSPPHLNGHPSMFCVLISAFWAEWAWMCDFRSSCPVSITEKTMSRVTPGWKALEPLHVNKLLPGGKEP